jgi:hypothetical protein
MRWLIDMTMKNNFESQQLLLDETSSKWVNSALMNKPLNKSAIRDFIGWLYQGYGLLRPEIHYATSPLVSQKIAREIRALGKNWRNMKYVILSGTETRMLNLADTGRKIRCSVMERTKAASLLKIHVETQIQKHFNWNCDEFGQDVRNVQWCSYYDFCRRAGFVKHPLGTADQYCEYVFHSGVFLTIYEISHVIVCPNPSGIKVNIVNQGNSHEGHEVSWGDGFTVHLPYELSIPVISSTVSPDDQDIYLTLSRGSTVEVTPEFLRKLDVHPIVHGLNIRIIDRLNNQWGIYELLRIRIPNKTAVTYLKMLNPSTGMWHFELVPPVRKCKQALAWRDGEPRYVVPNLLT